jgi:hypothetical protein
LALFELINVFWSLIQKLTEIRGETASEDKPVAEQGRVHRRCREAGDAGGGEQCSVVLSICKKNCETILCAVHSNNQFFLNRGVQPKFLFCSGANNFKSVFILKFNKNLLFCESNVKLRIPSLAFISGNSIFLPVLAFMVVP